MRIRTITCTLCDNLQAHGMAGNVTSTLINNLSPRDVSTNNSGLTCRNENSVEVNRYIIRKYIHRMLTSVDI